MVVLTRLDLAASPVMSLFTKMNVICPLKEMRFTYFVTILMPSAAERICAVVVIVNEVASSSGKFEVGAILAKDGELASPVCGKSSVIVC